MTSYAIDEMLAPKEREQRIDRSRGTRVPHAAGRQRHHSSTIDQVLDDSFPASDPPSWTGAISSVAPSSNRQITEALVRRVRAEFLEMPGLSLTLGQAQRLWGLERRACEALLNSLIHSRFLRRTDRGLFVLSSR